VYTTNKHLIHVIQHQRIASDRILFIELVQVNTDRREWAHGEREKDSARARERGKRVRERDGDR
jgi:hypothetical protein